MHRRNFILNTALLTAGSLLTQKKALAQMFGVPAFNIKMLRKNVGIFTERGGTIGFVLSKDGIVVIDAQFPDSAAHFIEEIKKTNTTPFQYLLNTHHHADHTSGNISFKGIVQHVVAHENSLKNQQAVAEKQNTIDKQLLPDQTFSKEWKLKIGDEKIKADYFGAGHTNGDAIYHFEEADIVHMGDLMFNRRHPFVDRSAGANITNWISVLEKASKKYGKDTMYIFGHANTGFSETGTADDLLKFRDYLQKVLDFAQQEIKVGKTKEEFIKNISIPGVTEWTGQGIERPLTAAYEELTESKKA
jgi:glyoxylase-like metal-dependent hydrolase (beta-lactamase superfamily II)